MRLLVRDPLTRKATKLPVVASRLDLHFSVTAQRLCHRRESRSIDNDSLLDKFASRSWRWMLRERFFFSSFQRLLLTTLFGSLFVGDEDSQVFGHQQRNLFRRPISLTA